MGGDDLFARAMASSSGAKVPIGGIDLFRVDQCLAIEAEFQALKAGGAVAFIVIEIEMHAIQ